MKGDITVFKMMQSVWQDEHDDRWPSDRARIVIVNDGLWDYARHFRMRGLVAWEMSQYAAQSEWGITGDLWLSPIRDRAIHIVWLVEPLMHVYELTSLMHMLKDFGFLVADLTMSPSAGRTLRKAGFERLPIDWHQYQIWRKPRRVYEQGGILPIRSDGKSGTRQTLQSLFRMSA